MPKVALCCADMRAWRKEVHAEEDGRVWVLFDMGNYAMGEMVDIEFCPWCGGRIVVLGREQRLAV